MFRAYLQCFRLQTTWWGCRQLAVVSRPLLYSEQFSVEGLWSETVMTSESKIVENPSVQDRSSFTRLFSPSQVSEPRNPCKVKRKGVVVVITRKARWEFLQTTDPFSEKNLKCYRAQMFYLFYNSIENSIFVFIWNAKIYRSIPK